MLRAHFLGVVLGTVVLAVAASSQQSETPKLHLQTSPAPAPKATPAPPGSMDADAATVSTSSAPFGAGLWDYAGSLDGSKPVHFTLVSKADGSISGSYFLLSDLQSRHFSGRVIDASSFSARVAEADASPYLYLKMDLSSGKTGRLTGALYGDGASTQHAIDITLTSGNPGVQSEAERYAIAGANDASTVEANAQAFVQAVVANEPEKAAAEVAFPLAYTSNGRRTLLHTAADFEREFPSIFTPLYIARLKNSPPKAMAANPQGIMLGDGEVWFDADGKAFALNNDSVKMFAGERFLSNAGWVRGASQSTTTGGAAASPATSTRSVTNDKSTSGQRPAQRRNRKRRTQSTTGG